MTLKQRRVSNFPTISCNCRGLADHLKDMPAEVVLSTGGIVQSMFAGFWPISDISPRVRTTEAALCFQTKNKNKGTKGVRARYDAALAPFISIAWPCSRPIALVPKALPALLERVSCWRKGRGMVMVSRRGVPNARIFFEKGAFARGALRCKFVATCAPNVQKCKYLNFCFVHHTKLGLNSWSLSVKRNSVD